MISVLMSYAYRVPVAEIPPCHLMLDCGAYTAISKGKPVTVPEVSGWYAVTPAERYAALDVIYDPVASRANALDMRARGLNVIPVVHPGTDPAEVDRLHDDGFGAVALGGTRFGHLDRRAALGWIRGCLDRADANGMERHGFAYCPTVPRHLDTLLRFTSVDVTSWIQNNKWGLLSVWDGSRIRLLNNRDRLSAATLLRRWPMDVTAALTRTRTGDGRSWMWNAIGACSFLLFGRWLMERGGPRVYLADGAKTMGRHLHEIARIYDQLEAAL